MKAPPRSRPMRAARPVLLPCALSLLLLAGCGGGEGGGESPEAEVASAATEAPAAEAEQAAATERRYLPDEMRRSTRSESFPHFAHEELGCRVCHEAPRGHAVHQGLQCAECHRASARATRQSLSPEECMACHHSPERDIPCSSCHDAPGPRTTSQQVRLAVWATARQRSLPFDHGRHAEVTCNACHQQRPSMAPTRSCASCHEDHHRVDARCQSCHVQPSAGVHDAGVHLTCSGAGCHDAPDVQAMAQTRAVCLVCHQAQERHEVGRECVECHQMRTRDTQAEPWEGVHGARQEGGR